MRNNNMLKSAFRRFGCMMLVLAMLMPHAIQAYVSDSEMNIENAPEISETVAIVLAAMHLAGCIENGDWDAETSIVNVTPLYNIDDQITAYCVDTESSNGECGYIVVSADTEKPLIIEYSPETAMYVEGEVDEEVLYSVSSLSEEEKRVYYYGPLSYSTIKNENCENVATYGDDGNFDSANDTDEEKYDPAMAKELVLNIQSTAAQIPANIAGSGALPIDNPVEYIKFWYGGYDYKNYDYHNLDRNNEWIEPYIIAKEDTNACVLYATATIIHYWRPEWDYFNIVYRCKRIYREIWPASKDFEVPMGYHWRFVRAVLDTYDLTHWNTGSDLSAWSRGKSEISNGNPCILCIANGGGYKNHAVTAYAWTVFHVYSGTENLYLGFFKVQDGYNTKSKYVCSNFHLGDDSVIGASFVVYIS